MKCMSTISEHSKFKSYNFWVKMVSAVVLILRIVLNKFGYELDSAFVLDIATLVAGVLVILGIINEPTGVTVSFNENMEGNGVEENSSEVLKEKVKEKLSEVESIFTSFGASDKSAIKKRLDDIDNFIVSILDGEENSLKNLDALMNGIGVDNVNDDKVNNQCGGEQAEEVVQRELANATEEGLETLNLNEVDKATSEVEKQVNALEGKAEEVESNDQSSTASVVTTGINSDFNNANGKDTTEVAFGSSTLQNYEGKETVVIGNGFALENDNSKDATEVVFGSSTLQNDEGDNDSQSQILECDDNDSQPQILECDENDSQSQILECDDNDSQPQILGCDDKTELCSTIGNTNQLDTVLITDNQSVDMPHFTAVDVVECIENQLCGEDAEQKSKFAEKLKEIILSNLDELVG